MIPKIKLQNWEFVEPETAKFWLEQSEKRMDATIESIKSNKQAAYRVLSVVLPVMMAVSGYAFSQQGNVLFWPAAVLVALQSVGVVLIAGTMFSVKMHLPGAYPTDMITDSMILENQPIGQQYVLNVLSYLDQVETRIDNNMHISKILAESANRGIFIAVIAAPLAFAITAFLSAWCR